MSSFLSAQFRADDPFDGIAPGSAVAEYDIVIGPVIRYLRDVVTDRSVRLLADFVGTSHPADERQPGDPDHAYDILAAVRVPVQRRHEHHHVKQALHLLLPPRAAAQTAYQPTSEATLLSAAWSHLRRASPSGCDGLIDLRQCCGQLTLGADHLIGASE
ncbi:MULTISPECIES: hypothetical protein [Bradyrhizobium]|uniref:Uncharacterized protein n=2 Tax=Bradyrhizobium elkanii TaxID=29448 RepID=A0ABV4EQY8_BRAEL|nr:MULTISPECIES: hypothetical protein [Bradyrhizobium]MCP1758753.1 hypothetical protein [Bradyrhizobium elkanii]MCP1975772.1 hypothetical protein [Bradyrhizobium elkanii]MCP1984950.1 hypothetical protein [Bradyrhizobium elkanii]MCS3695291.1 hypothetical protein [Bradyrhizobium elkanii]MCS3890696.1 hypothetical protein [Bradyrhizobium elkanii]